MCYSQIACRAYVNCPLSRLVKNSGSPCSGNDWFDRSTRLAVVDPGFPVVVSALPLIGSDFFCKFA